jgi:uncharacterized protein with PQ loop repeat
VLKVHLNNGQLHRETRTYKLYIFLIFLISVKSRFLIFFIVINCLYIGMYMYEYKALPICNFIVME